MKGLEIKIIKTHYKEGTEIEKWSDKIIDMITNRESIDIYGEVLNK